MKTFNYVPEIPIGEDWTWNTNVIVSSNGTEQRISLRDEPKRSVSMKWIFDQAAELQHVMMTMMVGGEGVLLPFYQAATRLTASVAAGSNAIAFRSARTDVRSGGRAILFDHTGRVEAVALGAVTAAGAALIAPLGQSWGRRANIAPVWPVYAAGEAVVTRNNPDYAASIALKMNDLDFMVPFANQFAAYPLTMFNGYPVLNVNSIGAEFDQTYDTGVEFTDYGGKVESRNPWLHAQIVMPRVFLCQRVLQPDTWAMWRAFADYAKGSANPFYLPTFRQDFAVAANPGNGTISFEGTEYNEAYAPFEAFRQLAFVFEDGGVQFAKVADCVAANGRSIVTFAPALPAGRPLKRVSMLLKVRIADDRISCEHSALETRLTINLRTVDE